MLDQQTGAFSKTVLRDGSEVIIRRLFEDDRAALLAFGAGLPEDDRLYVEDDLESQEIITRLVNAHAAENWRQIVALHGERIVGYGAVRRLPGWSSHVADIQLIISADWRHKELGTNMAQAIFGAARELGAAKVIVEMVEEQSFGRAIFERLGFGVEGALSGHVRDRHGQQHNLLILAYHVS
ncbi:MAG TPA: GNAT family N-acetyltransferase [Roseiflexaceae bacterium]|nr:GNAT family N-acetyltransferase [Roseiflexaceae bacterium]